MFKLHFKIKLTFFKMELVFLRSPTLIHTLLFPWSSSSQVKAISFFHYDREKDVESSLSILLFNIFCFTKSCWCYHQNISRLWILLSISTRIIPVQVMVAALPGLLYCLLTTSTLTLHFILNTAAIIVLLNISDAYYFSAQNALLFLHFTGVKTSILTMTYKT